MSIPVNTFGRSADLGGIAYHLVTALPGATVQHDASGARITAALPSGAGLAAMATTAHLRGPDGEAQRAAMASFLRSAGFVGPGYEAALEMVDDLHLSIAFVLDDAADQDDLDVVVDLAVRAAGWADGFVLALAAGVVLGPDGDVWAETEAALGLAGPGDESVDVPGGEAPVDGEGRGASDGSAEDDDIDDPFVREARQALRTEGLHDGGIVVDGVLDAEPPAVPPSVDAAQRRALIAAAVAARCLNEVDGEHLADARAALLDWIEATGAAVDLDAWEATTLAAAPGAIGDRDLIAGCWRTEGALVLAWASGVLDALPGPDRTAEPGVVFAALGLAEPDLTASAFALATPRTVEQVERLRRTLRTVHWRLGELEERPGPLDLVAAAAAAPAAWGGLGADGLTLVDGDLALDGVPVAEAPAEVVARARSIAAERLAAANWLATGHR